MKNSTVLVIDDDLSTLQVISFVLEEDNQVVIARDGIRGLELATKKPYPDLILLDIIMPGIDGYEVIKQLKQNIETKYIPVIFLTCKHSNTDEARGLKLGAVDYINKPINLDLFKLRVGNQLERIQSNYKLKIAKKAAVNAKEVAEKANKAKSEFLANMSHELRTPMHGIVSFVNMSIDHPEDLTQEKALKYFGYIKTSADRLMGLLNDLLDLAKLESGKMEMNYSENTLKTIVDNCISEQQARLTELNVNIVWNMDSISGDGFFDAARISQVVTNYLSNAIKFTPQGKKIELLIAKKVIGNKQYSNKKGDSVPALLFSVKNYGKAIHIHELVLIFDKFEQGSGSITGTTKGTGLGLPICKEIIKAHSGKLWAENHPDGGAIFSFIIPVKQ